MPIQILNGVAVKPGRLASGSYLETSPIAGDPFGPTGRPVLTRAYPNNYATLRPPYLGAPIQYDPHPMDTHQNTGTIGDVPQMVEWNNTLYPVSKVPNIQPHERGTFMMRKIQPLVYRSGQSQKSASTPFHPGPKRKIPVATPAKRSAIDTSRIPSGEHRSFVSRTRLHGDANRTQMTPGSRNAGRWPW